MACKPSPVNSPRRGSTRESGSEEAAKPFGAAVTVSTAGERVGSQIGRATKADTAGSAGKRQPPAAGEARKGFGFGRAAGGDLRQRLHIVPPILPVAAEKLEADTAAIEPAELILELRGAPVLKRFHICLPTQSSDRDDYYGRASDERQRFGIKS